MRQQFDAWLEAAYPELVTICEHVYTQAEVFKRFDPIAYDSYYEEWCRQERVDHIRLVS